MRKVLVVMMAEAVLLVVPTEYEGRDGYLQYTYESPARTQLWAMIIIEYWIFVPVLSFSFISLNGHLFHLVVVDWRGITLAGGQG